MIFQKANLFCSRCILAVKLLWEKRLQGTEDWLMFLFLANQLAQNDDNWLFSASNFTTIAADMTKIIDNIIYGCVNNKSQL